METDPNVKNAAIISTSKCDPGCNLMIIIILIVSSPKSITSGVPQGSVLGPLLFLLYVNDLPNHVQSPAGIKIFADDTKLYLGYTENQNTPLICNP